MLILRDWYHIRKKYYKNTENAKAVYYIKQKLYWENIANVPFLGVRGNIIARYYNRKLIRCYGIFVGDHCKVGEGLKLPHPNGIVIGNYVKIGNNCTIFQQTTLGAKSIEAWKSGAIHAYPAPKQNDQVHPVKTSYFATSGKKNPTAINLPADTTFPCMADTLTPPQE